MRWSSVIKIPIQHFDPRFGSLKRFQNLRLCKFRICGSKARGRFLYFLKLRSEYFWP
jgi:hypothetical protein